MLEMNPSRQCCELVLSTNNECVIRVRSLWLRPRRDYCLIVYSNGAYLEPQISQRVLCSTNCVYSHLIRKLSNAMPCLV